MSIFSTRAKPTSGYDTDEFYGQEDQQGHSNKPTICRAPFIHGCPQMTEGNATIKDNVNRFKCQLTNLTWHPKAHDILIGSNEIYGCVSIWNAVNLELMDIFSITNGGTNISGQRRKSKESIFCHAMSSAPDADGNTILLGTAHGVRLFDIRAGSTRGMGNWVIGETVEQLMMDPLRSNLFYYGLRDGSVWRGDTRIFHTERRDNRIFEQLLNPLAPIHQLENDLKRTIQIESINPGNIVVLHSDGFLTSINTFDFIDSSDERILWRSELEGTFTAGYHFAVIPQHFNTKNKAGHHHSLMAILPIAEYGIQLIDCSNGDTLEEPSTFLFDSNTNNDINALYYHIRNQQLMVICDDAERYPDGHLGEPAIPVKAYSII